MLKYFLSQAETGDPDKPIKTIESGLSETKEGEIIATIEEWFTEKNKKTWLETGMQQGEDTLLMRLLEHKFKIVPKDYQKRIEEANAEDLLKWGERVLDSHALEDVFKS